MLKGISRVLEFSLLLEVRSTLRSNQISRGFIQLRFENLQGWRLHNFPGQPHLLWGCSPLIFFPIPSLSLWFQFRFSLLSHSPTRHPCEIWHLLIDSAAGRSTQRHLFPNSTNTVSSFSLHGTYASTPAIFVAFWWGLIWS